MEYKKTRQMQLRKGELNKAEKIWEARTCL